MPHQGRQLKEAVDRYKPKDPDKSSKVTGFAAEMGISRQWVYRYFEKEYLEPAIRKRAAEILDIPEAELFTLYSDWEAPLQMVGEDFIIRSGNLLEDIGDGLYRLHTLLVDQKSAVRYLTSWGDNEYLGALKPYSVIVREQVQGLYRSFQIATDDESMYNPGSNRSIEPDDIVTGRLLNRSLWPGGLPFGTHPYWVIVHKTEGIITRQITDHDAAAGIITCRPLSPDQDRFPLSSLSLDDVIQLFSIIKVEKDFR